MKLADYTTVRLGGPARAFVRAETEHELIDAVRAADAAGEPLLILDRKSTRLNSSHLRTSRMPSSA